MLPASARLRTKVEFSTTVRRGVRAGRPTLVMYATRSTNRPTRAGFVVSKAVGNAVVRNRVKRRLRHLVLPYLGESLTMNVVIRALPAAASEPLRLADDLRLAWSTCLTKLASRAS